MYSESKNYNEINKSSDGLVRSAVVKVGNIESVKAISHLYSLECRAQGDLNNYRAKKSFRSFEENTEDKTKNEVRMKALRNITRLSANANPETTEITNDS